MNNYEGSFCYAKIGSFVFIYFTLNITSSGQYGYIPEGYRPGFDMHFTAQRTGSNEVARGKISASGGLHFEQYVSSGWHTGCVFYGAAN